MKGIKIFKLLKFIFLLLCLFFITMLIIEMLTIIYIVHPFICVVSTIAFLGLVLVCNQCIADIKRTIKGDK